MATITKLPNGSWRAQVRLTGHPAISRCFDRKSDATRWAQEQEVEMRRGVFVDTRPAERMTITAILDWYEERIMPALAATSQRRERSRIAILRKSLGVRTVATTTSAIVGTYIEQRRATSVSADTVIRELTTLSRALEAAQSRLHIPLPRGNPVAQARADAGFDRTLQTGSGRSRRLVPGEEERLLAELHGDTRTAVILLLETGMRRGELCAARREHLDMRRRTLHIPKTKTGEPRTIPLSERALSVIREMPARIDGRLLSVAADSLTHAFARACKRAGITGLRIHDLRHETTSRLFERGFDIQEVAAITGHADWKSLKRYTHIEPETLAMKLCKV